MADWLSLTCVGCHVRFRIKAAYAHLPGRCPECGLRIDPPRPQPNLTKPDIFASDEPLGLVELEPEWPEPALIEKDGGPKNYGVGTSPGVWIEESKPREEPVATSDIFAVADKVATPPAPPPPPPDIDILAMMEEEAAASPAAATPQVVPPSPAQLSDAELNPIREGPPPKRPLWDGIYTFPISRGSLFPLLWLWFGFTLIGLTGAGILALGGFMEDTGGNVADPVTGRWAAAGVVGFVLAFIWLTIFTGSFGAASFLAAIEDTSAGNTNVQWPTGAWKEWFFRFIFLLWLVLCSFLAMGLLYKLVQVFVTPSMAVKYVIAWLPLLGLFPLFLLSTLAANSWWALFYPPLLQKLGRYPQALVMLFVHTVLIGVPCLLVGMWTVFEKSFALAPVMGLVWAAGLLAYGRAVGRVGYVIREDAAKPKSKRKGKGRPRAVAAPVAQGEPETPIENTGWGGWEPSKGPAGIE